MKQVGCRNTMAERHAAAPQAAVRGGDAGGLAAGDASRATGTSVATVTTSLAAVELCDEDVAMRCSAQSDANTGTPVVLLLVVSCYCVAEPREGFQEHYSV